VTSITSYACSCAEPFSVDEELKLKTAIFSGKVVEISEEKKLFGSSNDPILVTFDVTSSWKGVDKSQVTIRTAKYEESCGYTFKMNTEYLVYAYGEKDDLKTGYCGRTDLLTAA